MVLLDQLFPTQEHWRSATEAHACAALPVVRQGACLLHSPGSVGEQRLSCLAFRWLPGGWKPPERRVVRGGLPLAWRRAVRDWRR
ncbi:MAG: hypothetical protein ACK6BC_15855 [Cyanobacteriota bacterium]